MIGCIVTAWNSRHLRQCALMEPKDDLYIQRLDENALGGYFQGTVLQKDDVHLR